MPSTTFMSLTALAALTFIIMQPYMIAHTTEHINRIVLGSLIPTVVFGHIFAFNGGRGKQYTKAYNTLAVMAVLTFLIMQPYMIARTAMKSQRVILGCLLPPVLAGHIFAYLSGRSFVA